MHAHLNLEWAHSFQAFSENSPDGFWRVPPSLIKIYSQAQMECQSTTIPSLSGRLFFSCLHLSKTYLASAFYLVVREIGTENKNHMQLLVRIYVLRKDEGKSPPTAEAAVERWVLRQFSLGWANFKIQTKINLGSDKQSGCLCIWMCPLLSLPRWSIIEREI